MLQSLYTKNGVKLLKNGFLACPTRMRMSGFSLDPRFRIMGPMCIPFFNPKILPQFERWKEGSQSFTQISEHAFLYNELINS